MINERTALNEIFGPIVSQYKDLNRLNYGFRAPQTVHIHVPNLFLYVVLWILYITFI